MEGALQDVRSIGLSQFFGPGNRDLADPFEAARAHAAPLIRTLMDAGPWDTAPYHTFYNVNFPPVPATGVKGAAATAQGRRPTTRFAMKGETAPNGRRYLWVRGGAQDERTAPGTDVAANLDGFISVTPMRPDLTAHDLLGPLEEALT